MKSAALIASLALAPASSLVATVGVRNAAADVWDALKFRMMLWPASPPSAVDNATASVRLTPRRGV